MNPRFKNLPANRNSPNPTVCRETPSSSTNSTYETRQTNCSRGTTKKMRKFAANISRFDIRSIWVNIKRVHLDWIFHFLSVFLRLFELVNFFMHSGAFRNKNKNSKNKISMKWVSAAGGHGFRHTTNWKVFYDSICIIHGAFTTMMLWTWIHRERHKNKIPYWINKCMRISPH